MHVPEHSNKSGGNDNDDGDGDSKSNNNNNIDYWGSKHARRLGNITVCKRQDKCLSL